MPSRLRLLLPTLCAGISIVDLSGQWLSIAKDWVDPNLGAEPDITDAPRVIGGVVQ